MADTNLGNTQFFSTKPEQELQVKEVLDLVYNAMEEKGYNPVNQIVGYIMSGDPTYITSHKGARSMIMKVERDELVEELLYEYNGSRTVGVAVSDPLGLTAQGVETIWRDKENHLRRTLSRIEEIIGEYSVTEIVLGYPKNMNNSVGERALKSLEFRQMLERRTGLPVVMWDERLSTAEAERTLMEAQVRRENRKQYLDQMAAVLILQGYLDRRQSE